LTDVYNCIKEEGGEEIILSAEIMQKARKCIDTMLN